MVADETKTNQADEADKANVANKADDTNEAVGASAVAEANYVDKANMPMIRRDRQVDDSDLAK